MSEHPIDPEVVAIVESLRDRFGLHGLRDAAGLIDAEILRVHAETEAAFAAADDAADDQT